MFDICAISKNQRFIWGAAAVCNHLPFP